jgi:hypothetical protein
MNPAPARNSAPPTMVFRDAFGERRRMVAPAGSESFDVLCLKGELTAVPSFEFALRERFSRLSSFRHPYFAQVRTVERLTDTARTLAVISNATPGVRLSTLLDQEDVLLDSQAALCLVRQLVTAMATFHEFAPEAAHGALGPERIVITPNARLVIVEHVMGSGLEQLQYSEERYWKELRVACPRTPGLPIINQRTDVLQLGTVALALLLRRLLTDDESPHYIGDAFGSAAAMSVNGDATPLPAGLRSWLTSALQLDPRATFSSAIEARRELEGVFERHNNLGAPSALAAFLARYHEEMGTAPEAGTDAVPSIASTMASSPVPAAPEPTPASVAPVSVLEAAPVTIPAVPAFEHDAPLLSVARPQTFDPASPATPVEHASMAAAAPAPAAPAAIAHQAHTTHALKSEAPAHGMFEHEAQEPIDMPSPPRRGGFRAAIAATVLLAVAGGGTVAARKFMYSAPPITTGHVAVTTTPPGAQILIDGRVQGISPTTLTVAAGAHVLELRGSGDPRRITLNVAAGAELSQYIELGKATVGAGSLQVRTEPAGARVGVDGVPRGTSPVTIGDLAVGEHIVTLDGESGSTKQTVTVEAGATASLVAQMPSAPAGPASGWISVSAPRSVQLFEDGRLLGTSDTERLMVQAGAHQIEIVNEALGYRSTKSVQVGAGKVSSIKVEFPQGAIALNAVPWADVWIDGEKVGETPIGNLPIAIGQHEIVFRHPDLGERRQVVTVTTATPARVSVDMRKP